MVEIGANSIGSLMLAAVGARVDHAHARHELGLARQRGADQRHAQLVRAGLDRGARGRHPARREAAQRGQVAQVQADRAGVVLAQHDPVERAFGRFAQREQVDVAVARARLEVRVERRAEPLAQARRGRAVLGGRAGGSGRLAYFWISGHCSPANGNDAAGPSAGTPVGASRITVPNSANGAPGRAARKAARSARRV